MTNAIIQSYINKNAHGGPRLRGLELFKAGAVREFKLALKDKSVKATVLGTKFYSVSFKFDNSQIINVRCSCPYNYGGLCKHEVAALFHFARHLENNPQLVTKLNAGQKKRPKHHANTWYEFSNYKKLSREKILNAYEIPEAFDELEGGNLIDISENYLSLYADNWRGRYILNFKIEGNKLLTKCSCDEEVEQLCMHQGQVLLMLSERYGSDFFTKITTESVRKLKEDEAKRYNLPENEDFYDLFEVDLIDRQVCVVPTGKAKGLLPADKSDIELPFLAQMQQAGYISAIAKEEPAKKSAFYALGFRVLQMTHRRLGNITSISPLIGKLSKDKSKFINPIRKIGEQNNDSYTLTPEDDKLIKLAELTDFDTVENYMESRKLTALDSPEDIQKQRAGLLQYYADIYAELIPKLANSSYCYYAQTDALTSSALEPVIISDKTIQLKFQLTEDNLFYSIEPAIYAGDVKLEFSEDDTHLRPLLLKSGNTVYRIANIKDDNIIAETAKGNQAIRSTKNNFNKLWEYVREISKYYPVENKTESIKTTETEMIPEAKQLYISELGQFVTFQPYVLYNGDIQVNILERGLPLAYRDETVIVSKRDEDYEKNYGDFIKSLHPKFAEQFDENFFHLQFEDLLKNDWFFDVFEKFKKENVEIFGLNDLKKFKYSPYRAKVSVQISSGQDWFDVDVQVAFGDETVSLKDIQKAVKKNDRYVKLSDGSTGIIPQQWFDKFQNYFRQGQMRAGKLKISKLKFTIIDELFDKEQNTQIFKEIAEKKARLKSFTEIKNIRTPKQLKGKLRDYQKAGYNWLNFLDEFKWGGILADDMGLGKTIQILAFLLKQSTKSKKANLVILPTTLIFNWQNELEKFAPTLKAYVHYGLNREKKELDVKSYDLIITTYGIMARDIELLRKYKFNYIILDESQAIKNPGSQRFKAAALLRADNRIALTGTPIENNTFDLYAQMEFLNPGFLGTPSQFKAYYSDPIDKDGDPVRAAELQNLINPFILRRTKEQVATELPPKTEDFIFCEMESEQRKIYDAFRNKYRNLLLNKIEDEGLGKSKIYVLEGLMKLRQICDTPEILKEDENYGTDSVKIRELIKHIKEKTGNHKILVFSQFVKMLDVIQRELTKEKIIYEYLDGKSSQKARQASVEHFQTDDKCRVFLVSLKAGGTGLNLTAADYVYIVDPWWNPAVENQAIDRSYRIGQDKHVIAYRMICKNTIEEKIMKYQAKKSKIASDIISTDDSFVKQLDKNDIADLFG